MHCLLVYDRLLTHLDLCSGLWLAVVLYYMMDCVQLYMLRPCVRLCMQCTALHACSASRQCLRLL